MWKEGERVSLNKRKGGKYVSIVMNAHIPSLVFPHYSACIVSCQVGLLPRMARQWKKWLVVVERASLATTSLLAKSSCDTAHAPNALVTQRRLPLEWALWTEGGVRAYNFSSKAYPFVKSWESTKDTLFSVGSLIRSHHNGQLKLVRISPRYLSLWFIALLTCHAIDIWGCGKITM